MNLVLAALCFITTASAESHMELSPPFEFYSGISLAIRANFYDLPSSYAVLRRQEKPLAYFVRYPVKDSGVIWESPWYPSTSLKATVKSSCILYLDLNMIKYGYNLALSPESPMPASAFSLFDTPSILTTEVPRGWWELPRIAQSGVPKISWIFRDNVVAQTEVNIFSLTAYGFPRIIRCQAKCDAPTVFVPENVPDAEEFSNGLPTQPEINRAEGMTIGPENSSSLAIGGVFESIELARIHVTVCQDESWLPCGADYEPLLALMERARFQIMGRDLHGLSYTIESSKEALDIFTSVYLEPPREPYALLILPLEWAHAYLLQH